MEINEKDKTKKTRSKGRTPTWFLVSSCFNGIECWSIWSCGNVLWLSGRLGVLRIRIGSSFVLLGWPGPPKRTRWWILSFPPTNNNGTHTSPDLRHESPSKISWLLSTPRLNLLTIRYMSKILSVYLVICSLHHPSSVKCFQSWPHDPPPLLFKGFPTFQPLFRHSQFTPNLQVHRFDRGGSLMFLGSRVYRHTRR